MSLKECKDITTAIFNITNRIPYNLDDPGVYDHVYGLYNQFNMEYDEQEVMSAKLLYDFVQGTDEYDSIPKKDIDKLHEMLVKYKQHVIEITEYLFVK